MTFLGQLVPRKGVDLAMRALATLHEQRWEFVVVGTGAQEQQLRTLAHRLGIAHRVRFLPARPNQEAIGEIARSDLFILPSRFDGWGAVVNEALMCGVPVLCSSRCGAADLIQAPWLGEVFPADSVAGLRPVLARWIAQGKRTPEATERVRSWSDCITGASAAEYLLSVIRHVSGSGPRPVPPWYIADDGTASRRPLPLRIEHE
jgi:glycosyltransferase involved in cell wall biosynthesis